MQLKKTIKLLSFIAIIGSISAQKKSSKDSLSAISFVNTVNQSLQLFYSDYANSKFSDSIILALNYSPQTIPEFSDDIYCQRLAEMNNKSPFGFDCNSTSLNAIRNFAKNRRAFIKIVLGRSALYFDLFEEKLAEYDMPLELKFLACIESGLRPQVKSHAGALGLWQFMYRTGLYYGLEETSYYDERMDPIKATDAACRCLKKLFGIYNDWNLALAAYNAGPGTVNRAIQRSGNKRNYWEIRPFLPNETQGYVPTFIATAYLMTYHMEHNILPAPAKIHNAELDTMCLKKGLYMQTISSVLGWDLDEIKELNPLYKTEYIPASEKQRCVTGHSDRILRLVELEDSLYKLDKPKYNTSIETVSNNDQDGKKFAEDSIAGSDVYHKVLPNETLNSIAEFFKVSTNQIKEWNSLSSDQIFEGQRLRLINVITPKKPIVKQPVPKKPTPKPKKKYYTVKAGDTMSLLS